MTVVIDTSLWVRLLKDQSGQTAEFIEAEAGTSRVIMLSPIRLELLQGCRGEAEWNAMHARLDAFERFSMTDATWDGAARIYFDLRQAGWTVRSTLDCCIAQACIELDALLLHQDRDFETIAKVRPLRNRRYDTETEEND
jgi:predicted nucleic acid-binding protein